MISCPLIELNLTSPSIGTPLHVACIQGNIKVVQKLILSGVDISLRDHNQKLAKECTENHKIVFLLEKYEKLMVKQRERVAISMSMVTVNM